MNDVIYAIALLFQQVDPTTFQLMTEPVKMAMDECLKMAMDECLKMAVELNMDNSHPFILACVPFNEVLTEVVQ